MPQPEYVAELGLLDGLDDLLRRADVVAVAVPITDATRGMLSPERLALLKPGAYLLVLSRGGIVDEPALARMLREGTLAGAPARRRSAGSGVPGGRSYQLASISTAIPGA